MSVFVSIVSFVSITTLKTVQAKYGLLLQNHTLLHHQGHDSGAEEHRPRAQTGHFKIFADWPW